MRRGGRAALACLAMVALADAAPASAQELGRGASSAKPSIAQASAVRAFDIAAQPLGTALVRFSEATGIQLFFDASIARGLSSPGVSGTMTAEEALRRLLVATGLVYRFTNPTTITLEKPGASVAPGVMQIDPVQVQASTPPQAVIDNLPPPYAGGQVASGGQLGMLGERNFMNTPFNQSSYTSKLIENQQAHSVAAALTNDPSIRNSWPAVGYNAAFMIRGFSFNNYDTAFGGLYGVSPPLLVTPEYLERIEVLKGPNVMLNGMPPFGSIAGGINLIPKRAPDQELNRVTANFVSNAQFGGNLDFARRFDDDRIGFRFNGVYRNGNTPVDRQTQAVGAAVFGLDFRGERLRASLDYGYQTQTFNSPLRATYVAAGIPVPLAPGGRSNWFQPWTFVNNDDLFGAAHVEYDITSDWTVFGAAGGRWSTFNSVAGFAEVTSYGGNLTDTPFNFPGWTNANTQEVGMRGRADSGPI